MQGSITSPQPIQVPDRSHVCIRSNLSAADIPVLLVTTSGADPSKEMEELAERTVGRGRYQDVAMGGGQQEIAVTLLRAAAQVRTIRNERFRYRVNSVNPTTALRHNKRHNSARRFSVFCRTENWARRRSTNTVLEYASASVSKSLSNRPSLGVPQSLCLWGHVVSQYRIVVSCEVRYFRPTCLTLG